MASDPKVLSHGDTVLHASDVELLRGDHWLNDTLIGFQLERLADGTDGALPPRCAAFVPPAMAFLLSHLHDPADAGALFVGTGLDGQPLALLAVNNNRDVDQAAGGSHWSLLAYHRCTNTFRHYDSMAGTNSAPARQLAAAAAPLVQPAHRAGGGRPAVAPPTFVEVHATPQQANGHDCGLHVLVTARELAAWQSGQSGQFAEIFGGGGRAVEEWEAGELRRLVTPAHVAAERQRLLLAIEHLATAAAAAGQA